MPTPPSPTSSTGPRLACSATRFERRKGREARAHVGAGERRRQRGVIDQIARMRHQHMRGKAAIDLDAEVARRGAQILLAGAAGRAFAAADPGKHRDRRAGLRPSHRGPACSTTPAISWPSVNGSERSAAHVELLVAAEAEIAVLQMNVGMAHAAAVDPHQHFAARAARGLDDRLAQRRRIGGHRLTADHASWLASTCFAARAASATKPSTGISSARAVGSMPAAASSGTDRRRAISGSPQHLAALAESGRGDAFECAAVAGQRSGARDELAPATRSPSAAARRPTGAISNRIFASRAPAGEHGEPAIGLRARLRHDALGDLALEHQHQPVVPGRPRLGGEPADEQRGRDVVGQVGDDARRPPPR